MHKVFIFSLQVSIVSCAVSVSLSQLFLFLSLILYFFDKDRIKLEFSPLLKASLFLFITYLVSFTYQFISQNFNFAYLASARTSELKDILLFSGFIIVQNLGSDEEKEKIQKAFLIFLWVVLITGFISCFSPIRLSRLLSDLVRTSPNWKFTHHYGDVLGIGFYVPIGLMNTHLTFGGFLLFFTPLVLFRFFSQLKKKIFSKESFRYFVISFIFLFVVLLNNARSAIMGSIISILFALFDITVIKKEIPKHVVLKIAIVPLLTIALAAFAFTFNETTRKTVLPFLGEEKHTDSGRTFIWHSTFPIIKSNPVFGAGPGRYNEEIEKSRKKLSEENKELLFFYEVTQRGHAHNDYFHIAAVFGFLGLAAYLLLSSMIAYTILSSKISFEKRIMFYGLVGFFFAGLYQCYFQDDEVVIVFWLLAGFLDKLSRAPAIEK
ncbi:MAG: O-antigen ligase family protein [Leptospira sp.]|nr:O-antigen ligase family protein [Leptospira sp.]